MTTTDALWLLIVISGVAAWVYNLIKYKRM